MAAEIERELIFQTTKEALRVKKANSMILGHYPHFLMHSNRKTCLSHFRGVSRI